MNTASGHEKGNGTTWSETTLDSGGTLSLISGRDTVINGAQASGNTVAADVGRDLWIASQQDSNDYQSKQTSMAAGGSFTFGTMTGSGYISASQDKMQSDYDSVQEQSGIFAGSGGFDITVGNHTQLDGGVIASTATADKNSLDTGTPGWRDIHNEADYTVSHSGISISGAVGDSFSGNMAADGSSHAAISNGTITVRDKENQQQDIAGLSRDTAGANGSISPIFDKEKEQNRLQEVQLIGELGGQAADIVRTQGELNGLSVAKKAHPEMSAEALKNTPEYRAEMSKYGTGSDLQRGIQAATAALQGLSGGDMAGALAGRCCATLSRCARPEPPAPGGSNPRKLRCKKPAVFTAGFQIWSVIEDDSPLRGSPCGPLLRNVVSLRSTRTSCPRRFKSSQAPECKKPNLAVGLFQIWSVIEDSNLRPLRPERSALPGCANHRIAGRILLPRPDCVNPLMKKSHPIG